MKLKEKIKAGLGRTSFKKSTYMSILTVIVLAIVVVINVLAGNLPTSIMQIDISENKIYQTGEVTEEVLDSLDTEVEIIVIAETGTVDSRIEKFVAQYGEASSYISVSYVDPTLMPSILTTYDCDEDTIVVSCESTGRYKAITFDEIIELDSYYAYYGYTVETAFDGEGELTTAIDYVVSENSNTVYQLQGHSETTFGDIMTEKISRSNIGLSTWTLMTDGFELPEDCSTIVINQPTADINEDELAALEDYLAAGGNIIYIISNQVVVDTPNLDTLTGLYGITKLNGYVGDEKRAASSRTQRSYYICFPEYSSGDITGDLSEDSELTLMYYSFGISVTDVDGVTVDEFLTTSTSGLYLGVDSDSEVSGQFTFAATATKEEDEDVTSSMTVYAGGYFVDETFLTYYGSMYNAEIFMNSITAYYDDVNNISIDSVSLEQNYNTITNYGIILAAILIFMVALIVIGIVVWNHRRKL